MKKSLIAILLALAMALPMTGCSSSAKSTPTPAPADTSAPADTTPADEGTTAPEGYPDGPISMLVGYTAGGGSDLAMRTFDEFLSPLIGEPLTVSNLPGGGATVAVAQLQNSKADGQTIGLVTLSTQSVSPYSLDLPYTIEDF